jgi:hypothetical protein
MGFDFGGGRILADADLSRSFGALWWQPTTRSQPGAQCLLRER